MAVNENSSLRSLQLSVELCSLFAKDDSEHAKIELANIMKHHFQAGESVVLYGKKERGFRLFKAGARRAKKHRWGIHN